MKLKNICIIPARGSSKEIRLKNLKKINNRSLLDITIEQAEKSKVFDRIFVSTESKRIYNSIKNLDTPFMRPTTLSKDKVHVSKVILHVLKEFEKRGEKFDVVTMLMPTSPLRKITHINDAHKLFLKESADSLVSLTKLNKLKTNLRFLEKDYKMKYLFKTISRNVSRQSQNELYGVNGSIFISTVRSFKKNKTFHIKNCIGFEMPFIDSIDINSEEDLYLARLIYNSRKKND